jgi:Ca2+-binding EF-hand superfamily protein
MNMKISKIILLSATFALASTGFNAFAGPHIDGLMFAKMDKNADGVISRDEAAAFPRLVKHFDQIDTNHDGNISKEEMKAAHALKQAKHLKSMDVNNDGMISREEAANSPRLVKHFDRIDTNKDGLLSKEELVAVRQHAR